MGQISIPDLVDRSHCLPRFCCNRILNYNVCLVAMNWLHVQERAEVGLVLTVTFFITVRLSTNVRAIRQCVQTFHIFRQLRKIILESEAEGKGNCVFSPYFFF